MNRDPREHSDPIMAGRICAYCGNPTRYVDSIAVYRRSYGMIYWCKPCDAYVGVHDGTSIALGRVANAELRDWKKKAHAAFDPVWKDRGVRRGSAYARLAKIMGLSQDLCHIGMFTVDQCRQVVDIANGGLLERKE